MKLERARRFERPTLTLARLCSTPELRPHRGPELGKSAPDDAAYCPIESEMQ